MTKTFITWFNKRVRVEIRHLPERDVYRYELLTLCYDPAEPAPFGGRTANPYMKLIATGAWQGSLEEAIASFHDFREAYGIELCNMKAIET